VQIITETNVPHAENISYFGDGSNEAQMVYQFSLPPLVLHTFRLGDVTALNHWATSVQLFSPRTTYFNFTASHDGIGVTPALGLLSEADIAALVKLAEDHGGYVSYKNNHDGSRSPYELNITYFDAINPPALTAANPQQAVARFIVSQAILLAFLGVPGIYFHSLFGSRNWRAGVQETGRYRTINRQKLEAETLLAELRDATSLRASVYHRYRALLAARIKEPAFHPLGSQRVLEMGAGVFALERIAPDGEHRVLALHHVRGETVEINLPEARRWRDLLTDEVVEDRRLHLSPYQVAWLKAL
jgi:sucrose phosphorylase